MSVLTIAVRGAVAKIFNNQHFSRTKAIYENALRRYTRMPYRVTECLKEIYENALRSKTGKWNISKIY